ncbi:MAG: hypothetical protein GY922_10345 [Proteobacteria bacterium]|jgi:hypothetical protein|nr:hypothetical protein [Pseudomonadota bacterium]
MDQKKIHIKLNHKNKITLTENAYTDFSNQVYILMKSLYAGPSLSPSLSLGGTESQIMAFMTALQGEKRYMDSYLKHGLDNASTMTSKYDLDRAVLQFEGETGLRWPFKN